MSTRELKTVFMIIGVQNQLSIFGTDFIHIKILRNCVLPTNEFLSFYILLHIKTKPKVIRK